MIEAGMWGGLLQPSRQRSGGSMPPVPPTKFFEGQQVGEWTLLEYIPGRKVPDRVPAKWRARCSCGVEREVHSQQLTNGQSKSCGHARRLPRGNPVT